MKVIIYKNNNAGSETPKKAIANFSYKANEFCILNSAFKVKLFLRKNGFEEIALTIEGFFSEDVLNLLSQNNDLQIQIIFDDNKIYNYGNCFLSKNVSFQNITTLTLKAKLNYNNNITKHIAKTCSAKFCDKFCGLNVNTYTHHSQIKKVISPSSFENNADIFNFNNTVTASNFSFASLQFTSGQNAGLSLIVSIISNNIVSLLQLPKYQMQNGDDFTITQSCNKTYQACKGFNNTLNYRGF